ncbi:glutathione S-transferase kappa 1-like isoform X2 [Dreissena polymorpha]|uniref:glutathione S-transferase kappa 1-like isoform X2 n=1 Tax=Dreissena polymorpha TaxID=45954 RepID=UPI0022649CBF|nr:glutathione S-transferase kappa 1-like isoform X2 [Dreissena polymorpha]
MAATMKKTVELFYDVVSPYTWFAFEVLCRYQDRWNINLQLKPVFLGGIRKGADNPPPDLVSNRGLYLRKELKLLAKYFHVPLVEPQNTAEMMFVKGTLKTQRFITAVDIMDSTKTEELSRQMWHRNWSRDEDVTEPASLKESGKRAGLSDAQISRGLEDMQSSEVKARLKQFTDEALNHGAFGSPTIIAHTSDGPVMLFGSDRFPILAQVLDEKWEGTVPGESKL